MALDKNKLRLIKSVAFAALLMPIARIAFQLWRHTLGADPVAITLNRLGFWTLTFLLSSLACTPMKSLTGWTWPLRLRRMIGLFAFFYAALHLTTYAVVDQQLDWHDIFADIVKRKFITIGFAAFLLLVPLAVTSTDGWVRRLGFKRWKRIHRLVYVAAVLGVLHFIWRVKADLLEPVVFAGVLLVLFLMRILDALQSKKG